MKILVIVGFFLTIFILVITKSSKGAGSYGARRMKSEAKSIEKAAKALQSVQQEKKIARAQARFTGTRKSAVPTKLPRRI